MNLALEVYFTSVRVCAGSDVDCRHVKAKVALPYALHKVNQVRVSLCQLFVPQDNCIIVVLCGVGEE